MGNDNFTNAIVLDGDSISVTASNLGATGELNEPNHARVNSSDDGINSLWWRWSAPENGLAVIDTIGSNYDTSLAVYTGAQLDSLVEVASNDDSFGLQSQVSFSAVAGQTYSIAVDGYRARQGDVVLNLELGSLENNNFADATALTGDSISVTGSNRFATGELNEPNHAGVNFGSYDVNSLWWNWTAPANGLVSLDTIGSDYDTSLAVYTGTQLSDLVEVASNDDSGLSLQSQVSFSAIAGQTYSFAVDGYGARRGNAVLNLDLTRQIFGTAANDSLNGSSADEQIIGLGGDDIINGNGGSDELLGGGGSDRIAGSSDSEILNGGDGQDILWGNGGEDTLIGGRGDDILYGGAGADNVLAGAGNDTIYANGGGDIINSGVGSDTIWLGGDATVILDVGDGFDTINNFQLGATVLDVSNVRALSFADSASGARISQGGDLLAVVSSQSASTLSRNLDMIFV